MVMRHSNICRICLKDNVDNAFISLRGNRDLKVKFFYCFSIALSDTFDDHMLCQDCINQLNQFYQLKNHVQRTHSIFFGVQPHHNKMPIAPPNRQQLSIRANSGSIENTLPTPAIQQQQNFFNTRESSEQENHQVIQTNVSTDFVQVSSTNSAIIPDCIEREVGALGSIDTQTNTHRFIMSTPAMRQININSKLRQRQLTADRIDIAEAINRLQRSSNSVFINKSRSIQVHRANQHQPSPLINEVFEQSRNEENYIFPPIKMQKMQEDDGNQPTTSRKSTRIATTITKYEPVDHNESPDNSCRGKQRGEIGKFIYQDKATMRFPCVQCGKTYRSYQSIYAHIRSAHIEKRNVCDNCGQGFKSKKALRDHVDVAHAKTYQCNECFRIFKSAGALSTHLLYRHQRKPSV